MNEAMLEDGAGELAVEGAVEQGQGLEEAELVVQAREHLHPAIVRQEAGLIVGEILLLGCYLTRARLHGALTVEREE